MTWASRRYLLAVLSIAVVGRHAWADDDHCPEVRARGTGQDFGGGVTRAQIEGNRHLDGTTEAHFVIVALNGTVATLMGSVVFTTRKGTLTVGVVGVFDVSSGAFRAVTTTMTGTGSLEGAHGILVFDGTENLTTGAFTENLSGNFCVEHDQGDDSDNPH